MADIDFSNNARGQEQYQTVGSVASQIKSEENQKADSLPNEKINVTVDMSKNSSNQNDETENQANEFNLLNQNIKIDTDEIEEEDNKNNNKFL